MRSQTVFIRLTGSLLLAVAALLVPAAYAAAAITAQNTLNYSAPLPAGVSAVKVENLVGRVSVTQGSSFTVTATVVAGGSDQAAAQALARTVKLDASQSGSQFVVHVHYPVDQYDSYRYTASKSHGDLKSDDNGGNVCLLGIICFNGGGSSGLRYQDTRVRVYTGGERGTPLYVDLSVQVPAGMKFDLSNYVGRADLKGLNSDTSVKTSSADVWAGDITGKLSADTGSGDVHVSNLTGDYGADTGSGDVFGDHVTGSLHADTGSGDVHLSDSNGKTLYADTGSGDVTFNNVKGDMRLDTGSGDVHITGAQGSLHANTGSGEVQARNYTSGASVWADTGSGDVSLSGDLSAMRKLYIDTGSGDATLRVGNGLSLHLDASSDSGAININLPGMRNVSTRRGEFIADFGAAAGSGTISTGSGDITVTSQHD